MKTMLLLTAAVVAAAATAIHADTHHVPPVVDAFSAHSFVSAGSPVTISTRRQLANITNDLGGAYVLGADINLSNGTWKPIGTSTRPFTGTLAGNGHKITGLAYADTSSAGSYAGLFAAVKDATLDGIHLKGVSINGRQYTGALAGDVQGATTIRNCTAEGVVSNGYGYAGLLVGRVNGSGTTFSNCAATGAVVAASQDAGGLVGGVYGQPATFADCDAQVTVSGTAGNNKGGFIGSVRDGSASATFTRSTAGGAVIAPGSSASIGGFIGYADKPVSFEDCAALGGVSAPVGQHVGGFVGQVYGKSNDFHRCMSAGATVGKQNVGAFGGYFRGATNSVRECFALGDATALNGSDAFAGGFAGKIETTTSLSDSYSLGTVRGHQRVGGFAGGSAAAGTTFARCYAAGVVECAGIYAGAFAGYLQNAPAFADCAVLRGDGDAAVHALGTSAAGASAENAAIAEYDAAGMKNAANFSSWLAYRGAGNVAVWSQADGVTQPHLAWSAPGGSLTVYTSVIGGGEVEGAGEYAPGAAATVSAIPEDGFFVRWTGSTPYADPTAQTTTIPLDNHRVAVAQFGKLITTAGELDAVRDDLGESYALGADIDLSNGTWAPIGTSSQPFTGTLIGNGHKITDLRYDNASGSYAGLFAAVKDATLDGIHLEGVSINGRQYTGALAGDVQGATTIHDCSAEGIVSNSYGYAGLLVGRVNGSGTAFSNCAATGAVTSARADIGGLVGGIDGYAVSFADCDAAVAVSGTTGDSKGGFVGSVKNGDAASFTRCTASGDVTSGASYTGGFIGSSQKTASFVECAASGKVDGATQTGGFVGYVSASNVLVRCTAEGMVRGATQTGGFVGQANGNRSQYVACEARGPVTGTGGTVGGFVGQIGSAGLRFAECAAFGAVSAPGGSTVGGFVGQVSNSNDLWRCMSAGAVVANQNVGAFGGNFYGADTTVRECFALGDATALNVSAAYAGGFAGRIDSRTFLSDSYSLGTVRGRQRVGGFAGHSGNAGTTFARCYAAGVVEGAGTYAGAFAGYLQNAPAFADCAVLRGDGDAAVHALGTSAAGASAENAAIAEYDAAGMKNAANFSSWLAYRGAGNVAVWSQADGVTQPHLAWSAPGGSLTVYTSVIGGGEVEGAGEYAPGAAATVSAIPEDGFFVRWTGSTPYADPTAQTTTIPLDNHRVAAVQLGKLITTADELDAVRDDLAGFYGLGADIDLTGLDWTPLGNSSAKFTGTFYGFGHAVMNLTCTNNPSNSGSDCRGLFGRVAGATLDGIVLTNCDVAGYQYVGALAGRIDDGTVIAGCSASGKVQASNAYAGGLVGACDDGAITIRDSDSAVETTGGSNVGGFIGRVNGDGASTISECRADGFVSGGGRVGGFIGNLSAPAVIADCAARGDVKSTGDNLGGFIGYLGNASATNANCWASGAVWGTGDTCGSFAGNCPSGTIATNCAVSASANGARQFCGGSAALTGCALTDSEVAQRSMGWPEVAKRSNSECLTRITTAEQLRAITNHLDGAYALAADIDLGGAAWTPIGTASSGFTGEFYGNNHVISNFTVSAAAPCAGLFGNIAGGRVEGVQAFGSVTSTSSHAGGFAGRICLRSLVRGCSFVGSVSGSSTQLGGFAGHLSDAPSVFECCAVGAVSTTADSGDGYVGGFVGQQNGGGFIADSYARVAVDAGAAGYAGGFAGGSTGSKIVRTYCSGAVTSKAADYYVGAFGGNLGANIVTNSYYDSGATEQLAAGKPRAASVAYAGIDAIASADMTQQASFPAFAFPDTWKNGDDTLMPYLLGFYTFTAKLNSFASWVKEHGLPANSQPGDIVGGLPLAARFVFGIDDMASVLSADNEPVFCVKFDAGGAPYVQFARNVNGTPEEVTLEIIATENLADWSHAVPVEVDLDAGVYIPDVDPVPPKMFFRWRIRIAGYE